MAEQATATSLWISSRGRISCAKHGGAYLAAAVEAHPRRKTHLTPLDYWEQVDDEYRAEWMAMGLATPLACETCEPRSS